MKFWLRLARIAGIMAFGFGATLLIFNWAYAESTLDTARENGFIRVGFANEAPYAYATPDGKLKGESVDIARVIFKKMGIPEIDGVITEFGSLIPALNAKRFDVIAAGMFIRPKRCKRVAFSEPTFVLGSGFLVKSGNPYNLHSYTDIADNPDLTLGVMAGTVEVGYAKDAGVPQNQLMLLPDQASMIAAVKSGRADAAALAAISISSMADKGGPDVERANPFKTPPEAMGYGAFGFRKEDKALLKEFNRHLVQFIGTREHLNLVDEYGITEQEIPQKSTKELCSGK
jgi:polar amino acid transport system substrate-binding protein